MLQYISNMYEKIEQQASLHQQFVIAGSMRATQKSEANFVEDASSSPRPLSLWEFAWRGPSSIISLLKFIEEYKQVTQELPEKVQQRLGMAAVMVFSLWAYCEVSGRTLRQLVDEDVLTPGLLLYIVAVTQDDHFDELLESDLTIKAEDCFWDTWRPGTTEELDFLAEYDWSIEHIKNNPNLTEDQKRYIIDLLQDSWDECMRAEDSQIQLRNVGTSVEHAHKLKQKSYGVLGEALTAVLNGSENIKPHANKYEKQMIAFCMVGAIVDGLADMEEDAGMTISVPLAARDYDRKNFLANGTTAHNLLKVYLTEIDNPNVIAVSMILSKLYPIMVSCNTIAKKLFGRNYNPVSHALKV